MLERGIHRLKFTLRVLDHVFSQSPGEQPGERLRLLKMGAVGYGSEANAMRPVKDAANPYAAAPAKISIRANEQHGGP